MEEIKSIEMKSNSIQSMVNFLKQSPHKFDITVCDGYLKKLSLFKEFNDIVSTYLRDCQEQLDLTSVDNFTSEIHVHDISNRSFNRSLESAKKLDIKRIGYVVGHTNTMLKSLDEAPTGMAAQNTIIHSKRARPSSATLLSFIKDPKIGFEIRPRRTNSHLSREEYSQRVTTNRKNRYKKFPLQKDISTIGLVYINEVTQKHRPQTAAMNNL